MSPDEYCQQKIGAAGSSFYYSFLFLPQDKRRAITALYAFCREVDDVVDECHDPELARTKLAWWRSELETSFRGQSSHPVTRALLPVVRHYRLSLEQFLEIMDGMEMDINPAPYTSFEELRLYCHRVASVVGLMSASIFGCNSPRTLDFARNLGLALQLTNIIRDIGEDARRNRIYLPQDDLRRFGVDAMDILNARDNTAFRALMEFEAQRAYQYYDLAMEQLADTDRLHQTPSLIMAAIYRSTLDEIRNGAYPVLTHRVALPPLRKLWIAWKTQRREVRRAKCIQRAI
ncbi:MAG: presqualene diphosphate synthase HpnD [Acidiferrobacterales bacterium]